MPASITPPRFAHSEGYTAVAFGHSGQFVCTGGSDSLVRIFHASKNERDQEAITLEHHTDNVLSLAVSKNKILSGDEEGVVLSFDVSSHEPLSVEPSGSVLRSALSARDLSISSSERQVAVAADDDVVRVVSLLDMSLLHSLQGHRAAVTSVSFSPDSTFLASVGCDGALRVWDMRDDPACVHVDNKITYVCEPGNSLAQTKARWSPDGRYLAVVSSDHGIKLIERNSWEVQASLGGAHTKQVTCLAWSANGRYMASVGLDNKVVVWDVQARTAVLTHKSQQELCQVDWNPTANMLAFTDSTGAMYIWDDVIAISQGHAAPYNKVAIESSSLSSSLRTQARISEPDSKLMSDLFGDAAAVDEMISAAEMEEDEDVEIGEDTGELLDDFVVDDDGAGYAEPKAQQWAALSDQQTRSFQPGATPWISSRRYLAFNMVGSVAAVAQDAGYNTVELEFYDKSLRRDFHFSDSYRFSLAALSESGCVFATTSRELANDQSLREASDSDDEVSVLSYRAFASWSTNADWLAKLPENEHPRCIAASSHGVVAITSLGMLRCFSLGGAQTHIESLPDRAVTCVAYRDLLLIVLESAGSLRAASGEKRVEYEYILMSVDGQSRLATGVCPVTPHGEVVWAGFSEEGHPATCDSKGIVRLLHKYWSAADAAWVPVLDTRALTAAAAKNGKKEAYWPVAISAKQFIVVTCRNRVKYPPHPKPILDELDISIPLLQADTQVGQHEARLLQERLFYEQQVGESQRTGSEYPGGQAMVARDELEQDKEVLKLIQLACKAERTQRAMDLACMIRLERSFDAAIKIAVFQKLSALAERMMRLKEVKFLGEEEQEDEDEEPVVAPAPSVRRRPAATYGRKREENVDPEEDDVDMSAADDGTSPDKDITNLVDGDTDDGLVMPARRTAACDLVVRPPRPPTSKSYNPFGVSEPSKTLDLKRSDSFFNAADRHSKELSREPSQQESGMAESSKRGSGKRGSDAEAEDAPAKKTSKKTTSDGAGAGPQGRVQSKLAAFSFNKNRTADE